MVEISTNAICFEGICRVYRNAVVDRVREVLRAKYPDTWEEEIAKPFGNKDANGKTQWENLQEAARQTRSWGLVETPLADEGDLLDVSHFHNLFEKHFDALLPDASASDRDDLSRWMQSVKNLRDPVLGHPSGIDMLGADAWRMLDDAKKVLEKIGANAAAEGIAKLRAAIPQGKTGTSVALEEVRSLLSINAICFEGINRVYRNAVVKHIHARLSGDQISGEFQKKERNGETEWENRKRNAESPHSTGDLTSPPPSNDADLLDITHFPKLFKKYAEILFPEQNKRGKDQVRRWAKEISDYRGALIAHPAALEASEDDAWCMLDAAERILLYHIRHEDAAKKVADLWDCVRSEVETVERGGLPNNLPPREWVVSMKELFGRKSEVHELHEWLRNPFVRSQALAAEGGTGKSSIAYAFAESVVSSPPEGLDAVIWLTAKKQTFMEGRRVEVGNPEAYRFFWDLESALDRVLEFYGPPAGSEPENLADKMGACRQFMAELPPLVILDDLNSLDDAGSGVTVFFTQQNYGSGNPKFLLTSQRQLDLMKGFTIRVRGFEGAERNEFIRSRINFYGMEANRLPAESIHLIGEATQGVPLYINDLLRLCESLPPERAIAEWKARGGHEARKFALQQGVLALGELSRKLVLTLAFVSEAVSQPEIQRVLKWNNDRYREAHSGVGKLFLAPKHQLLDGVDILALEPNLKTFINECLVNGELPQWEEWVAECRSYASHLDGQSQRSNPKNRHYLSQAAVFLKQEEYAKAEETLLAGLNQFSVDAGLHGELGWVYEKWGKPYFHQALEHYKRASELKGDYEPSYVGWSRLLSKLKQWSSAAEAAEAGLHILGEEASWRLLQLAGVARSNKAKDLNRQRQLSRAEEEARKAEDYLKKALLLDGHHGIHRSTVLNYECLVRISRAREQLRQEQHFLRLLAQSLDHWRNEHPDDSDASSERQRLLSWFPSLSDYLDG